MARLTITLDDALHQALKEAAARQGRSIGKIIEEGLLLLVDPCRSLGGEEDLLRSQHHERLQR